jgi:hypothetical protein
MHFCARLAKFVSERKIFRAKVVDKMKYTLYVQYTLSACLTISEIIKQKKFYEDILELTYQYSTTTSSGKITVNKKKTINIHTTKKPLFSLDCVSIKFLLFV